MTSTSARAPWGADQVMVQDDDLKGRRLCVPQPRRRRGELSGPDAPGLVAPRPHRVQPDDVECRRGVQRLGRLPLLLELAKGVGEAGREGVRDVVVARDSQDRRSERAQEARRAGELSLAATVAEIAARHDQLRPKALDQNRCATLDRVVVTCPEMQVGQVENACKHGRGRL